MATYLSSLRLLLGNIKAAELPLVIFSGIMLPFYALVPCAGLLLFARDIAGGVEEEYAESLEGTGSEQESSYGDAVQKCMDKYSDDHIRTALFKLLVKPFTHGNWWLGVFVLAERLTLAIITAVLSKEQALAASASVVAIGLLISMRRQPFAHPTFLKADAVSRLSVLSITGKQHSRGAEALCAFVFTPHCVMVM